MTIDKDSQLKPQFSEFIYGWAQTQNPQFLSLSLSLSSVESMLGKNGVLPWTWNQCLPMAISDRRHRLFARKISEGFRVMVQSPAHTWPSLPFLLWPRPPHLRLQSHGSVTSSFLYSVAILFNYFLMLGDFEYSVCAITGTEKYSMGLISRQITKRKNVILEDFVLFRFISCKHQDLVLASHYWVNGLVVSPWLLSA